MEEEIRKQYETETGQKWCVIPYTHGENAYASWEYQLWLEKKVSQVEKPVILPKPNPQNGDWISVKDEQPPEKRYVIGYIEDAGNIVKCSKILTSDDSLWYYVTHWQHTPKPPLT